MSSVTPLTKTKVFNGDISASDEVNAADLDTQIARCYQMGQEIIAALDRLTDGADALRNRTVGLLQLKTEVLNALEGLPTPLQGVKTVATSNVALSGLQTLNGYTLVANDRVVLVGQTDQRQNGLWVAAAGAWSRPSDFASASTPEQYANVEVLAGSQLGAVYALNTASVTVDTTDQVWVQIQAANNGTTKWLLSNYSTLAAALTSIGATPGTLIFDTTGTLAGATAFPSTLSLEFTRAGKLVTGAHAATGVVVTGDPQHQIFDVSTGSVSGLWRTRPEWFGAVGDGVTNDAAAVQAAMDAAAGGTMLLASRTYAVDSTLDIPDDGLEVRGVSQRESVILALGDRVVFNRTTDDYPGFATFVDFKIDMETNGGSSSWGIFIGKSPPVVDGSYLTYPHVSLSRMYILGGSSGQNGVHLEGFGWAIRDCLFYGHENVGGLSSAGIGLSVVHPEQCSVDNTFITGWDWGIKANWTNPAVAHKFRVTGGAAQRCNNGIGLRYVREPFFDTYCEGNYYKDYELGGTAGAFGSTFVKNGLFRVYSASQPTVAAVHAVGTENCHFELALTNMAYGTATIPAVLTGSAKHTSIFYTPDETGVYVDAGWLDITDADTRYTTVVEDRANFVRRMGFRSGTPTHQWYDSTDKYATLGPDYSTRKEFRIDGETDTTVVITGNNLLVPPLVPDAVAKGSLGSGDTDTLRVATDETSGRQLMYYDGAAWRRVRDGGAVDTVQRLIGTRAAASVPGNFAADFVLECQDAAGNAFFIPAMNASW